MALVIEQEVLLNRRREELFFRFRGQSLSLPFWGWRWLEVPEDDLLAVQVLEGEDSARHVELPALLLQRQPGS